jgi:16S rRNA U516 pseudouridylate synthase RsuA-like enzyme
MVECLHEEPSRKRGRLKTKVIFIIAAIVFANMPLVFAGVDLTIETETRISVKELHRVARIMEQLAKIVPGLIGLQDVKVTALLLLTDNKGLALRYASINPKGTTPKAYYVEATHTIYTTLRNCKKHILAHELTHVLLDEYFTEPIPTQISEMIAECVSTTIREIIYER